MYFEPTIQKLNYIATKLKKMDPEHNENDQEYQQQINEAIDTIMDGLDDDDGDLREVITAVVQNNMPLETKMINYQNELNDKISSQNKFFSLKKKKKKKKNRKQEPKSTSQKSY